MKVLEKEHGQLIIAFQMPNIHRHN